MILVIRVCGNTSEFHIHLPISLFLLLKNEVSSQKQCYLDYRSYFLILINFNWRIITLQYCSYFCHTLTWVSHGCTCVPHPEPPLPIPSLRVILKRTNSDLFSHLMLCSHAESGWCAGVGSFHSRQDRKEVNRESNLKPGKPVSKDAMCSQACSLLIGLQRRREGPHGASFVNPLCILPAPLLGPFPF